MKYEGSSFSIPIRCRQFFSFVHKPRVFGNVLFQGVRWLTDFCHCETITKENILELIFSCSPARSDNYYGAE